MVKRYYSRQDGTTPKRIISDGEESPELNDYEHVVYLYSSLHESYGWPKKIIDCEELEYILDLMIVQAKTRNNGDKKQEQKFIDDLF